MLRRFSLTCAVGAALLFPLPVFAGHDHDDHRGGWRGGGWHGGSGRASWGRFFCLSRTPGFLPLVNSTPAFFPRDSAAQGSLSEGFSGGGELVNSAFA
jgi:hypothetical protein